MEHQPSPAAAGPAMPGGAASASRPGQSPVPAPVPHGYRRPQSVLARFVARRTARGALLWAAAIGLYTYASAVGFTDLAPTPAARKPFIDALVGNPGLRALMGEPYRIDTVGGFVSWRVTGVISLFAALWGLLTVTRLTRGEEAVGRWELFLAGRTTHRRAAANVLAGMGCSLLILLAVVATTVAIVGARAEFGFGPGRSLLLALSVTSAAAVFVAMGALAGQLMPTRASAAGLAAGIFGAAFILRALADLAPDAYRLRYLTPLGWIEQLHPLTDPRPVWLLPLAGATLLLALTTIWLAGRRDLGASTWTAKDTARPRSRLLGSHQLFAVRLARTSAAAWLTITVAASLVYGGFAATAGDAFASSGFANQIAGGPTHQSQRTTGVALYAGIIFLMTMVLLMAYVAAAAAAIRSEEAEGYLDNLLVRQVGRASCLATRANIILAVVLLAGPAAGVGFWLSARRSTPMTIGELTAAGVNAAAPAILLLGFAVLAVGFVPRWTATICYALIAWSFLIAMLGSVLHLNHWVLDTSLLQHPALAPAANPNWHVVAAYAILSALLAAAGTVGFAHRDLRLA
jgi:ABC-2 type transport system permease protein